MSFVIVSACTAILLVFTSIFETLIRVLHTPFIADARDYDRELGMPTWALGFSMNCIGACVPWVVQRIRCALPPTIKIDCDTPIYEVLYMAMMFTARKLEPWVTIPQPGLA